MKCYMCGSQLSPTDSICSVCGAKILDTPISNTSESQKMDFPILNKNNNKNNDSNNVVSANGFQFYDFNRSKSKNISLIDSNMLNKSTFNTEDYFSSPKVSVGYNQGNNVQNVSKNSFSNQSYVQPSINYNNNQNNQNNKREYRERNSLKINWKFVVVFFALLIIAGVGFISFDYFQKIQEKRKNLEQEEIRKEVEDSITDYEKQREEKAQQMKENINLASENVLYDGSLLFTYENNNNVVSAVEFIISFYDDNDELLGSVKEYAYPAPYTKFLIKIKI